MTRKKQKQLGNVPRPYHVKAQPLTGSDYREVASQAHYILHEIERKTRRQPYIRSAYFGGQKIFLSLFWPHLAQKSLPEQTRRLKYLPCALEVLRKSHIEPVSKENPNRRNELLHRFAGQTKDGTVFYVQIKENRKNDRKDFMSVFVP